MARRAWLSRQTARIALRMTSQGPFRELFEPMRMQPYFSAPALKRSTGVLPRPPGSKQ